MYNNVIKGIKVPSCLVFLSILTACGGGSGDESTTNENNTPSEQKVLNVQVQDMTSKALIHTQQRINVQAQSDQTLEIKSLKQINDNDSCKVINISGLSYQIQSDSVGECRYQYQVGPLSNAYTVSSHSVNTAQSRVAISSTEIDPNLPPVGDITFVNQVKVFNLETLLGADYPQGYQLEQDIQVLGDNSAFSAMPDTQNNSIEFSATTSGVFRIYFSLTDGANVKLGVLDIAVSETGNHPPVAKDYHYTQQTAEYMEAIPKNTIVTIDLKSKVSDPDSEDVIILSSVFAQNSIISNIDEHNLTFDFQSTTPGLNQISYAVTDGRGGFDFGVVSIDVEAEASDFQAWEAVELTGSPMLHFSAALSETSAKEMGVDYTSSNTEDGTHGPANIHVALMTSQQAQNYCVNRGMRLPTNGELLSLFNSLNSPDNVYTIYNWPLSYPYWTSRHASATTSYAVNLYDGSNPTLLDTSLNYVTCLKITDEVEDFIVDLSSIRDSIDPFIQHITARILMPDGITTAPYETIRMELAEGKGQLDNGGTSASYVANSNGVINFDYTAEPDTPEILLASRSTSPINQLSLLSSWNYIPGFTIDILSSSAWSQSKFGSTDLTPYVITPNLMPLVPQGSTPEDIIVNGYGTGLTRIIDNVHYQMYHFGRDGGYRVFLHQPATPEPMGWNFSGDESYPIDTHAYGLAINYDSVNGSSYTLISDGQAAGPAQVLPILDERGTYVWVDVDQQENILGIYISTGNRRPETPQIVIPAPQLDMQKPIYLGFSGVGGSDAANENQILALSLITY